MNFVCEAFGPDQLAIREIPVAFQKASMQTLIPGILEHLQSYPESVCNLTLDQKEVLQRQACRGAIKAGQVLSEPEVRHLVQDFLDSPQNYTCPHGRPLFSHFDSHKLETLFLRK